MSEGSREPPCMIESNVCTFLLIFSFRDTTFGRLALDETSVLGIETYTAAVTIARYYI